MVNYRSQTHLRTMQHMFPFKDPLCDAMQRDLVTSVRASEFAFELPLLSDVSWNLICHDHKERERLEFLGDALISASISRELFRCRPDETPDFYTKARSVLTANSTFAHLMHKLGFHNLDNPVKPAGDAYETILAVFHGESGPDDFGEYVRRFFTPLINTVGDTYRRLRTAPRCQKRRSLAMKPQALKLTRAQRRKQKERVTLKAKRAKSKCQILPAILVVPALPTPRPSSFVGVTPQQVVIDLTFDSNEEEIRIPGQPHRIHQTFQQTTSPAHKAGRIRVPSRCSKSSDDNIKSSAIVQSILLSPQVARFRKIPSNDYVKASKLSKLAMGVPAPVSRGSGDQDNLVTLLKRTSITPMREPLGTLHNPIMID